MRGGKRVKLRIVELTAIVKLDGRKRQTELSKSERAKRGEGSVRVRFVAKRNRPQKMSKIIQNNEEIFVAGDTQNGRCPKIAMN